MSDSPIKAKLRVVIFADQLAVAESDSPELWSAVLGSIVGNPCGLCHQVPREHCCRNFLTLGAKAGRHVNSEMAAIGHLIATQDNRITDQPIFIVQQKRLYVGDGDYGESRLQWVDDEGKEAEPRKAERLERAYARDYDIPEGWRRLYVFDVWEFVTACFTEQGCKDYIARDGHNLREPRIYAASSYRNGEWRKVRKFLVSLAAQPAKGKES